MNLKQRSIAVLAVQFALVISVYAKYRFEQATLPRVWVQVRQFDPYLPLRGRYLALRFLVDSCSLDRKIGDQGAVPRADGSFENWTWDVRWSVRGGKLIPVQAEKSLAAEEREQVTAESNQPCNQADVEHPAEFFVPDNAQTPFPLKSGESLWAEVTVPNKGPLRPIQLAIEKDGKRTILPYR